MQINPKAVKAGTLILQDGKVLLVQEKAARAYGLWNIPYKTSL